MKFTMLNKNNAKTIASVYGFRIDVTWAHLTAEERDNVARAMRCMGGKSVNGVAGYHFNLRKQVNKP